MTQPTTIETGEGTKSFLVEIRYTDTAEARILIDAMSVDDARNKILSGVPPTVKDLTFLDIREVSSEEYDDMTAGLPLPPLPPRSLN